MILSARQLTTFYEAWSERMASQRFAATLLREHESALASGDARAFSLWQAQLRQAAQHQLEQRLTPERLLRLPLAAGIMLLWAALCVATLRAQTAGVAVIGAGVAVGVWSMFFAPTAAFDIRAFEAPLVWAEELAPAARICFAATGILCAFALRQREVSPVDAASAALGSLALCAGASIGVLAGLYVLWGEVWTWMPPEPAALGEAWRWLTLLRALSLPTAGVPLELPLAPAIVGSAFALNAVLRPRRR